MSLPQKYIPLGNKILILPTKNGKSVEAETTKLGASSIIVGGGNVSDGGIIMPESATSANPQYGIVIATGQGNTIVNEDATGYVIVPLEVQAGDRVLYAPNDYPAIDCQDKVCLLMTCDQILCKIE